VPERAWTNPVPTHSRAGDILAMVSHLGHSGAMPRLRCSAPQESRGSHARRAALPHSPQLAIEVQRHLHLDIDNGRFTWPSWANPGPPSVRLPARAAHDWPTHAPHCCPTGPRGSAFLDSQPSRGAEGAVWPAIDHQQSIGCWRLRLRPPRSPAWPLAHWPTTNRPARILGRPHADRAPAD
jgi:hypothetical protein